MIPIPIPPSTNKIWRLVRTRGGKKGFAKSDGYGKWLAVAVPLMRAGLAKPPLPCRVLVLVTGGRGWQAGRDLDNILKPVIDALRHAERIPEDTTGCVVEVRARYEAGDGGPAVCRVGFFTEEVNEQ